MRTYKFFIYPLRLILVVISLILVITLGIYHIKFLKRNAMNLGDDLVYSTVNSNYISSKHVVFVGDGLKGVLLAHKNEFKKGHHVRFSLGDIAGESGAPYRIVIYSSDKDEIVAVRLNYDYMRRRFHILGFSANLLPGDK